MKTLKLIAHNIILIVWSIKWKQMGGQIAKREYNKWKWLINRLISDQP